MACAGPLKRCYEFDPVHSPSHHREAKRRRCMPSTLELSSPPPVKCRSSVSPFTATNNWTTDKLRENIVMEVKRLQSRRSGYVSASSNSKVCSSSFEKALLGTLKSDLPGHLAQASMSPCRPTTSQSSPGKKDARVFTLEQVHQICENILSEREEKLREEYDQILNNKLADQYEAFLKFNHDQISRQFKRKAETMSYLS